MRHLANVYLIAVTLLGHIAAADATDVSDTTSRALPRPAPADARADAPGAILQSSSPRAPKAVEVNDSETGRVASDGMFFPSPTDAPRITPQYAQPTHVEITYEAFFVLPAGAMRDEFLHHLGGTTGHDCSTLFPDSGTTITEGAYEEDCDLHFLDHFWDPDTNAGLLGQSNALTRARLAYNLAVQFYIAGEVESAYYELGRVAHLLEDMAQPAHVHLDLHGPADLNDNYEEICGDHAWRWSATAPPGNNAQSNSYVGYDSNGKLQPLPYATLPSSLGTPFIASSWLERLFLNLAETSDAFESEDVAADTDAIQFGHPRTTIAWHTTTTPPTGPIGEFTESEVLLHADTMVPLAIRYVASLYQLFWDETHPPTVMTNSATAVAQTTATLSALVNPNGAATTLRFDYGKTTGYGSTVTYGSVGSGTTAVTKTYGLTNLSCGTAYHYQARAENGAAVAITGGDKTFTTNPCTPACYPLSAIASPLDGGTVTVNTGQNCSGGYTSGTSVSITAAVASGYQFSGWAAANCTLGNAAAANTTCTITGVGTASVSAQFTTNGSQTELVVNGAFASGSTGWGSSGSFFADSRFSVCHSCPGYAYLSNADGTPGNNLNGLLYQTVPIPTNATSATVTFWYYITTQEVTTSTVFDALYVSVQDLTTGSTEAIAQLSNLTSTSGYVKRTVNLASHAGHSLFFSFSANTDGAKPTVFRIDDASILVTTSNCTSFTINPTSRNPSASAGSRTVTITGAPSGCVGGGWSASGNGSWLSVSPSSDTGSGSTVVSWTQNPSSSSRSANAMIAGNVFSVTQDGESPSTCTSFSIEPTSWSPPSPAGSIAVAVTGSPAGCDGGSWTTSSNDSWLSVTPPSGSGTSSATVSWIANTLSSSRDGSVTIAGKNFSVTQSAAGSGAGTPHGLIEVSGATAQAHDLGVGPDGAVYVLFPTTDPKQLWVVKSSDGGLSWQSPVAVPGNPFSNSEFGMAVDASGVVHVVWASSSDDTTYYSRSTNGGVSFSAPISTRTGNSQGGYRTTNATKPVVGADGAGNVYVAYGARTEDSSDDFIGYNVWLARSSNGGASFQPEFPINTISDGHRRPVQVRATASHLYVLYLDYDNDDLYCHRRAVGASSGTTGRVNATAGEADSGGDLAVAPNGATLYTVFSDTTSDNEGNITFTKSADGGVSWSAGVTVNDSTNRQQYNPGVGLDGAGRLHVAWTDGRTNGRTQTYYAYSENGGANFSINVNVSAPMTDLKFTQTHLVLHDASSSVYISATREITQVMVARLSTTPPEQQPPIAPTGLSATAVSTTRVELSWGTVTATDEYRIERKSGGGSFTQIGTAVTNTYADSSALPNTAYLYRVRASNEAGPSPNSTPDLATTIIFTDSTLSGRAVQSVHLTQLRTAVNALRALAGLPAAAYTYPATAGTLIRANDVAELRTNTDEARGALGLPVSAYSDSNLSGQTIKAQHLDQLRERFR